MKKCIISILRAVIFLSLLVVSLYYINKMLLPKYITSNSNWPTTTTYNQFYEMEEDTVDVFFFGSSLMVNAFSPQTIYNEYGIRSYNLASEQQSTFLSYYWLKEAMRFQKPKAVIMDTMMLFDVRPWYPLNLKEPLARKCIDPMKWSEVKREAVSKICELDPSQSELGFYLTNTRFHDRWKELKEYDMDLGEVQYAELKGYSALTKRGGDSFKPFRRSDRNVRDEQMNAIMKEYLDKMTALCKENDISLILVTLPGTKMNDSRNNVLTAYAKDHGLDYYNVCEEELYNSFDFQTPGENIVDHGNIWGAMKLSRYFGKKLSEEYKVPSVKDEQYEETKEFYDYIYDVCQLSRMTDFDEYVDKLRNENFTVFISVNDNASGKKMKAAFSKLKELGIEKDFSKDPQCSYVAVISPENGVSENLSENGVAQLSGSIRDHKTMYSIQSGGRRSDAPSQIIIDNEQYAKDAKGINIVVYDQRLRKVVSTKNYNGKKLK